MEKISEELYLYINVFTVLQHSNTPLIHAVFPPTG
jgi:hypothetical protein